MMTQMEMAHIEEAELRALVEETTELGLLAEDSYKNAAAAIVLPQATDSAHVAIDGERACAQAYRVIHQKSLDLLARRLASGDDLRRIVEVQQLASEFALISTAVKHLADQALALGGMAEAHLRRVRSDAPTLLVQLVRQVYVELRGCVVACTARDKVLARRLVEEDAELERLFRLFKMALEREIARSPRNAAPLNRLMLVGVYLRDIGSRVVSACHTLLYAPPASEC
jgi:phosphate uptake regulator